MRISVIICTFGRASTLRDLLHSLDAQNYRNYETLVIDGNDQPSAAREIVENFQSEDKTTTRVTWIASTRGLTRQRNVGLKHANGELICFLDDDVTLPVDFLSKIASIFERPEFEDVGGITGYDVRNYPLPVTLRWRLRWMLGVIPKLPPGGIDRLGRGIPLSFLQPFSGYKEVGLLPGFCMIYRRSTVQGLTFDEQIPTYGGEDRDFSMRVGWRARLLICGDLHLSHHSSPLGRDSDLQCNFQSGFGMGRRFAKYALRRRDHVKMVTTFLGDSLIDVLFLLRRPGRARVLTVSARVRGFFAGLFSNDRLSSV